LVRRCIDHDSLAEAMSRLFLLCASGLLAVASYGQANPEATPLKPPVNAPALPDLPKDPAQIFAVAAPLYDFAAPTLKPWHMKVSYQLYDDKNQPGDRGTYEYWWAGPGTYRSTWSRPGVEQTDWHVDGTHYHSGSGPSLAFFERKLQSDLLTPLPSATDLDPARVIFDRREQTIGGLKLPCVMLVPKTQVRKSENEWAPFGMFPTFCFNPQTPVLRAYFAFGATSVTYNKIARMQGVFLARELTIFDGQRHVLTATVDEISGIAANSTELVPRSDVAPAPEIAKVQISSELAGKNLIKQERPTYPQEAKSAHIQGKVELRALIGTDGHVHELSVIDGPSSSLIRSAMWAVSQWEYKPYLLNGEPVEVDTTIHLIYNLGP
jgi:TonB family protein